jgi:hypothetical protein
MKHHYNRGRHRGPTNLVRAFEDRARAIILTEQDSSYLGAAVKHAGTLGMYMNGIGNHVHHARRSVAYEAWHIAQRQADRADTATEHLRALHLIPVTPEPEQKDRPWVPAAYREDYAAACAAEAIQQAEERVS